jgi:hypothetical protein
MSRFRTALRQYGKFAILVLVSLAATAALFWSAELIGQYECRRCDHPNDIAIAISNARASLLQVVVGLAGAAALYFTWQTYLLGREGRTSDNFIKAVDQLGNEKVVHARVGGVTGLGRLLRTATVEGDYWPLMDVLTAFVRQSVPLANKGNLTKPSEDVQAAMNVIARRSHTAFPTRFHDSPVDLSQCDLSDLWMAGGHFEQGYFGDSVLRKTDLRNSFLTGANFDRTDISGAQFENAKMENARVRWIKSAKATSFRNADLTQTDFEGCNLTESSFEGANVCGADFSKALVKPQFLAEALGDEKTLLPHGFSRPSTWDRSRANQQI